jgi:hypothetical protein
MEKQGFYQIGQQLQRAGIEVDLTELHAKWKGSDKEEREAVQFITCYDRSVRGWNDPQLGTIIRKTGERLVGCWTVVLLPAGNDYRYPAGEDPALTGIQLYNLKTRSWGKIRPDLTKQELDAIYAGDYRVFDEA